MKPKDWIILSLTAIAAFGIGGFFYIKNQLNLLMDYCYKIKSFKLTDLSINRIAFNLYVLLENKSRIDAIINSYKFDVYINSIKVAQVYEKKKQYYAAEGVSTLTIAIDVIPKNIFKNWQDALKLISEYLIGDKSKISLKIAGNINFSHAFISRDIPIEMNWTMAELLSPSETKMNCMYLKK